RAGDWYPSSFSPAAAPLSEAFSLPARWRGGGEPSLEDCSRRPLTRFASFWISRQSAALWRAVGCTGHEPPLPPCGRGRLPCAFWPPAAAAAAGAAVAGAAAATTGPPGCDSPRLRFLFFFFLPPPWAVAAEPPALPSPSWGAECHARPSAALAHFSAREKSMVTLSTSCVANFSSIFSSRTPCRNAEIIDASEIRGMVPRTLVKREMKARSVYPGFCLTAWRWASTPCCWYALAKFTMNLAQSSTQDWI